MKIEPAGFLLNRYIPGDKYSEGALREARTIITDMQVPEIGLVRERQTLKSSREAYDREGGTVNTMVGLYMAQSDPRLNEATRQGIAHTINEVELAAKAVVEAILVSHAKESAAAVEV